MHSRRQSRCYRADRREAVRSRVGYQVRTRNVSSSNLSEFEFTSLILNLTLTLISTPISFYRTCEVITSLTEIHVNGNCALQFSPSNRLLVTVSMDEQHTLRYVHNCAIRYITVQKSAVHCISSLCLTQP